MGFGGYSSNGNHDAGQRTGLNLAARNQGKAKPKKTVFDTSMVIHVWAQQTQAYGRNAKASVFFDGPTLYSYGTHFVMARFAKPNVVLLNAASYSVTTSGHQREARSAVSQFQRFRVKYPDAKTASDHQMNLDWYKENAFDAYSVAKSSRHGAYGRSAAINRASTLEHEAFAYMNVFFPRRKKPPFVIPDMAAFQVEADKAEARRDYLSALRYFAAAKNVRQRATGAETLLKAYAKAKKIGADVVALDVSKILKIMFAARAGVARLESLGLDPWGRKSWRWIEHKMATAQFDYAHDFRRVEIHTNHVRVGYKVFDSFASGFHTEAVMLAREAQMEIDRQQWELERVEQQRLRTLSSAEQREAWRQGKGLSGIVSQTDCMLRVNGDEVQTSQGASFPVAHAIKAWPLIKRVYDAGAVWCRNGHKISLGHFEVDAIDIFGNLKAGCHTISKEEIYHCARLLELIE